MVHSFRLSLWRLNSGLKSHLGYLSTLRGVAIAKLSLVSRKLGWAVDLLSMLPWLEVCSLQKPNGAFRLHADSTGVVKIRGSCWVNPVG